MKAPTKIQIRVAIDGGRTAMVVGDQWIWLSAEAARVLAANLIAAQAFSGSGVVEATVVDQEEE